MTDPTDQLVRQVVAEHLRIDSIQAARLDRFVGEFALMPLDLVLIAQGIEDRDKIVLPMECLEHVGSIAQLANLVRRMHVASSHGDRPRLVPFARPGCAARRRSWLRRMVA
jgi:acyl carrier protein